jgi:ParB-like chromosome segregation protein Spo0J
MSDIKAKNIEFVSPHELVPHPKNMNKHSDDQINRLIKLIEYQGFRVPIVVQKGTNLIVAGHGRLLAAIKMGLEKVPVTYQEFESDAQLYAFMVSDNSIASWAELDLSMVNAGYQN